jgi:hypothetical protein
MPVAKSDAVSIDLVSHDDFDFNTGNRFNPQFPTPVVFQLDDDIGGREWPTLLLPQPVFHIKFLSALRLAGVSNIDEYSVEFIDRDDNHFPTARDYRAVNIIGLVDCIDLKRSEFEDFDEMYIFESITLNKEKAGNADFFRLARAESYIVVSSRIAARIGTRSFPDVRFDPMDS